MRGFFVLACLLPAGALAADILAARYDPIADELAVDIAYRGTHADHEFVLDWGPCNAGGAVAARLIDRHGTDAAREDYRVRERFKLAGLECRPARVTLRLGRVAHATVLVPGGATDPASTGASAGPGRGGSASDMFRRFDGDGDGYLSQSEMWAGSLERGRGWMARDANKDGRISPSEFAPVP